MYRFALEKLYKWKESRRRKPMIIEGARQVGKTWIMKEFGRSAYDDMVYINFDSNSRMEELFATDLNTDRLIMGIELYAGRKINPDSTLLIFMRRRRNIILSVRALCLASRYTGGRRFLWARWTFCGCIPCRSGSF